MLHELKITQTKPELTFRAVNWRPSSGGLARIDAPRLKQVRSLEVKRAPPKEPGQVSVWSTLHGKMHQPQQRRGSQRTALLACAKNSSPSDRGDPCSCRFSSDRLNRKPWRRSRQRDNKSSPTGDTRKSVSAVKPPSNSNSTHLRPCEGSASCCTSTSVPLWPPHIGFHVRCKGGSANMLVRV